MGARRDLLGLGIGASLALHGLAALWLGGHTLGSVVSPPAAPVTSVAVRVVAAPVPEPEPIAVPPPVVASPPPPPAARAHRPATLPEPAPVPTLDAPSAPSESPAPPAAEPATAPALAARALPPVETGPTPEEELARYKRELLRRIAAHKHYPAMARRRGLEGDVVLRLSIDASGRLAAVETPGRAPMVLAAQARSAAEQAAPFPPPPGGAFRIDFTLRFDLDE